MLSYRFAATADIPLLAEWNRQLLEDEREMQRFSIEQLRDFWEKWLASGYHAVLFFEADQAAAYALFRPDEEGTMWLRHFFVSRFFRRRGIGREAIAILREKIWPRNIRIILEVLLGNESGLRFWRALGFEDHAMVLQYRSG